MEQQILELESFLPYRLNRLAESVSREFSKIYRDCFGLTRPEWRTLATLGEFGTITATAIGEHSSMHKTKVSRAVRPRAPKWLTRRQTPPTAASNISRDQSRARRVPGAVPLAIDLTGLLNAHHASAALLSGTAKLEKGLNSKRRAYHLHPAERPFGAS